MGLLEYAKNELAFIGCQDDEMQEMMNSQILDIIKLFSEQGHSGFSANYLINTLERLMRFKPLTPLTGEDIEWNKVFERSDGTVTYQNKRCSSVFKDVRNGETISCHDIDGIAVSDNGGITWFSSGRFRKDVTFPYYPPTHADEVYIEYTEDVAAGETSDNYEIITDNPERIKALYKRKRMEFDSVKLED